MVWMVEEEEEGGNMLAWMVVVVESEGCGAERVGDLVEVDGCIDAVFCWKIRWRGICSLLLVAMCPRLIHSSPVPTFSVP